MYIYICNMHIYIYTPGTLWPVDEDVLIGLKGPCFGAFDSSSKIGRSFQLDVKPCLVVHGSLYTTWTCDWRAEIRKLQENSFRLEESIYKYQLTYIISPPVKGTFWRWGFVWNFPKLGEILVHWRVVSKCWCWGGIRFFQPKKKQTHPNLAVFSKVCSCLAQIAKHSVDLAEAFGAS